LAANGSAASESHDSKFIPVYSAQISGTRMHNGRAKLLLLGTLAKNFGHVPWA